jgi:sugar phosphate permease
MLYLHRYTFALIKPKLADEYGLSNTELGALDSAFSLFYMVFQFPSGVAADVLGAHLFLGGIILVWSLALGAHAWVDERGLWSARAAFGMGQAGAFASVNRVARTWFPLSVRTTAQGWMGVFSGRIGAASANVLFATVLIGALMLDWRTATYLFAAAGLMLGFLFLALYRNSPGEHPWANRAEVEYIEGPAVTSGEATRTLPASGSLDACDPAHPSRAGSLGTRPKIRDLLRRMSRRSIVNLFCINLTSTLSTIADNIYSNWIPLFLYEQHGMKFKEMGIYSALPLIGGACGGAFGGYLNDRLIRTGRNRRWIRSLIGLSGKGTAGVLIVVALYSSFDNPYRFCVLLFFVKFFADVSLATRWGAVSDVGGKATASVFGFNNTVASIGAIAAPVMYGYVSEHASWEAVFIIGGVMYALCAASWLLIDCTIPLVRDVEPT